MDPSHAAGKGVAAVGFVRKVIAYNRDCQQVAKPLQSSDSPIPNAFRVRGAAPEVEWAAAKQSLDDNRGLPAWLQDRIRKRHKLSAAPDRHAPKDLFKGDPYKVSWRQRRRLRRQEQTDPGPFDHLR